MTRVEFSFTYPDGLPMADTELTLSVARAGFVDTVTGVVIPQQITVTTDAAGVVVVPLHPSSSPYMVSVLTDPEAAEDSCCGKISYRFYVPETDELLRAQDLFLAPPPSNLSYDEAAILAITEAKGVAVAASIVAEESAATALEAVGEMGGIADAAKASEEAAELSKDYAIAAASSADASKNAAAGSAAGASQSAIAAAEAEADAVLHASDAATAKLAAETAAQSASDDADAVALAKADIDTKSAQVTVDAAQVASDKALTQGYRDTTKGYRDEVMDVAVVITGSLIERGSVDLSGGAYPPVPPTPSFWLVSVAGTVNGIDYGVGDKLVYSETLAQFYKIDDTESISSVNGKTGVVVINKGDVGLSLVDNTPDVDKPISSAQQTALALKAPLASPTFTGSPKAPTQSATDNSTNIATTAMVQAAIASSTPVAVAVEPVAGVLDLTGFTGLVALVSLTANVTSVLLPSGSAGNRRELMIEFTNTGNFTVSGWPVTLTYEAKGAVPVGLGAGVVSQYVLGNNNNGVWLMYGKTAGCGQAMYRVPATQRLIANCNGGAPLVALAMVAARVQYVPLNVPRPMLISALGVSVSTLLAGTGTIGIYDSDGDPLYDYPGTLLASSAQGAINTGTTGTKTAAVDILLLPGRLYFAAFINTSAVTLRCLGVSAIQPCLGHTDNSTGAITMYTSVSNTNVLPNPAPAPTTSVSIIPAIYLIEAL